MNKEIEVIRALVELGDKATPGTWRPDDEADVVAPSRPVTLPDGEEVADWPVASCATGMRDESQEDMNADFIAAAANARPAIRAMLARLDKLEGALKEARGYVVHAAAGYPIDSCLAQIDLTLEAKDA